MAEKVYVVYHDMISGYGHGVDELVNGLYRGQSSFRPIERFRISNPDAAPVITGGCFPEALGLEREPEHIAENSMMLLIDRMKNFLSLPAETPLFLALTQGETALLRNPEKLWTSEILRRKLAARSGFADARIYSAACASGNLALARAAEKISRGICRQIIVGGCDIVSEFVYSGFLSVHAITPDECRPYDAGHNGLLLGDAAGIVVLASASQVRECGYKVLAEIAGYGITTDAFHVAAPSPDGKMMMQAVKDAMNGESMDNIGGIIGHGTGTALNDDMEIAALSGLFPEGVPLASIKGGSGHVLAASGLVQLSCAVDALARGGLFPQTGLLVPQAGAEKFVSSSAQLLRNGGREMLSLNAGFGGINAVIRLRKGTE